jgi:ABC-type branched-subunit amino acid transport system permease subunit
MINELVAGSAWIWPPVDGWLVAVLPLPDFWIFQLNYIGLYALTCLGLVLLTGVAGLTSFGQAAFVGIGAYTTAWLTLNLGLSPWLTLLVGLGLAAQGPKVGMRGQRWLLIASGAAGGAAAIQPCLL